MAEFEITLSEYDADLRVVTGLEYQGFQALYHHWDVQKLKAQAQSIDQFIIAIRSTLEPPEKEGDDEAKARFQILLAKSVELKAVIEEKGNVARRKRMTSLMAHIPGLTKKNVKKAIDVHLPRNKINPIIPEWALEEQKWFDVCRDAYYSGHHADGLDEAGKDYLSDVFNQDGRRFYHTGPLLLPERFSFQTELAELQTAPRGAFKDMFLGLLDVADARKLGFRTDGRRLREPNWTLESVLLTYGVDATMKDELLEQVSRPGNILGVERRLGDSDTVAENTGDTTEDDDLDLVGQSFTGGDTSSDTEMMDTGDAPDNGNLPSTTTNAPVTQAAPVAAAGPIFPLVQPGQHAPFAVAPIAGVIPPPPTILPGWTPAMRIAAKAARNALMIHASSGTNPRASIFNRIGPYEPLAQINYTWSVTEHSPSTRGNPPNGIHPVYWSKAANDANSVVFNYVKKINPGNEGPIAKRAREDGTMRDIMIMKCIERGWIVHNFGPNPSFLFDDSRYNEENLWYNAPKDS